MKKASFKTGSSGSPKHTEVMGSGKGMGAAGRTAERGIRIGPGVMGKRVMPDYAREAEGNGGAARGKPGKPYSEG